MNYYYLLLSSVLPFVLLKYAFPKIIYILCEMILSLDQVLEYCENQKEDFTNCVLVRLFYVFVRLIVWGIMIILFIPMYILTVIEVLGGFTNAEMLKSMD